MKSQFSRLALAAVLGSLLISIQPAPAQGTAFTYQGELNNNGSPANGSYDLQFSLFDAATNGDQIGGTVTNLAVGVTNGLFTTTIDFGPGIFTEGALWLQIGVETNGGGNFVLLGALQPLTPTPDAIFSENSGYAQDSGYAYNSGTASSLYPGSVLAGSLSTPVAPASGQVLAFNGASLVWSNLTSGGGGNGWSLTGNAGTTPGTDFLGTTDNEAIEVHVDGMRGMRVEPTINDANHTGIVNVVNGASVNFDASGVYGATISGGGAGNYYSLASTNSVLGDFGSVGGGAGNTAGNQFATVAGGIGNNSSGFTATVGGGENNTSSGNFAIVAGGQANQCYGFSATVAGGAGNGSYADYSSVAGGVGNIASGFGSFVGGGGTEGTNYEGNSASGGASTVAGGLGNNAENTYATVGGGVSNTASGPGAFVGGGGFDGNGYFYANMASGGGSTIGGGLDNTAGGVDATVGGGFVNSIAFGAGDATVGGGRNNTVAASGSGATVGGGEANYCSGEYATIPGGYFNQANGLYSFAAGQQARALQQGAFVWADSQSAIFNSTGNDQFCVRAQGGVQLDPSTSMFFGAQTRQMLNLYSNSTSIYAIGVQTDDMYFRTSDEFWWYEGGTHNNSFGNAGGGTMLMRLGSTGNLIIAGTLTQNSDRNVKGGFESVDPRLVLEKVAAMPVTRWHYTNSAATPHIGPMAQDFYAAFGLGEDDKHITTIDEGGVALAAIQGLDQKLEETRSESKATDAEIEELKAKADKVDALEKQVNELKQMVQLLAEKK
jgi:hypothetical protein